MKPEIARDFFQGRVDEIAKNLLGKLLVNEENSCGGIIVETEAYLGKEDPASHLVKAGESRGRVFEKGAGTVYVFKIYHHANLNFISEYNGTPEGVLIRAIEPVNGIEEMMKRREVENKTEITSGPGKLTEALAIEKDRHNGENIEESPVSVYRTGKNPEIEVSRRIGISEAEDWPLRFTVKDNEYVSGPLEKDIDENFDINHLL